MQHKNEDTSLKGQVVVHEIESLALKENALGDTTLRRLHVYLPPGYISSSPSSSSLRGRYPVLLALAGMFGDGGSYFPDEYNCNWNLAARMDRLITDKKCVPTIIVAPDCDTCMGGSQYVNSEGTGRYQDYITQDIMPFVRATYGIPPSQKWGVFGVSSGGYGAIMNAMMRPDLFACVADHSGDGLFDMVYKNMFHEVANEYRRHGGVAAWYRDVYLKAAREDKGGRSRFGSTIVALALARIFSPNRDAPNGVGCDFPYDMETGEFHQDTWDRWTSQDPVYIISYNLPNLRKLKLIYLDAGQHDEFNLQHAARNIHEQLKDKLSPTAEHDGDSDGAIRVPVVHYEEYDGGHFGQEWRYDVSLPMLAAALLEDE